MISLDWALDRLLHRRSYLEAFLAGQFDELDVSQDDLQALLCIDPVQLRKTAQRVRADVLTRKHRGSGGLLALYPCTLEAWKAAFPEDHEWEELSSQFLESAAFEAYRETSFAGAGVCLEEAFFRFAQACGMGHAVTLESEFLTAMMKALVVSPRPDFTLPPEIHPVPDGFFAISTYEPPTLYAAVRENLVLGPITPFIADLLLSPDEPINIACKHTVTDAVLEATMEHLAAMGLRRCGTKMFPSPLV